MHWWQTIERVLSSLTSSAAPQLGHWSARPGSVFSLAPSRSPRSASVASDTAWPTDQPGRAGSMYSSVATSPCALRRSATTKPPVSAGSLGNSPSAADSLATTTEATSQARPSIATRMPTRSDAASGAGWLSVASNEKA